MKKNIVHQWLLQCLRSVGTTGTENDCQNDCAGKVQSLVTSRTHYGRIPRNKRILRTLQYLHLMHAHLH